MDGRLRDYIPSISLTAIKVALIEKFTVYESNTEIGTTELQSSLETQSKPIIRCREKKIQSEHGRGIWVGQIRLTLENRGAGVAQNLYIRPSLVVHYDTLPEPGPHIDIEDASFLTEAYD